MYILQTIKKLPPIKTTQKISLEKFVNSLNKISWNHLMSLSYKFVKTLSWNLWTTVCSIFYHHQRRPPVTTISEFLYTLIWFLCHSFFCPHLSYTEMVFCYQNCSDPLWEKVVLLLGATQTSGLDYWLKCLALVVAKS